MKSIKTLLTALLAAGLTAGLTVAPANAAAFDYYNHYNSAYAINVWTGTYCSGTHSVLQIGGTKGNTRSYKVNAYSKFKVGSGSYSRLIGPNVCVTAAQTYTVTVYVYSNN